MRLKPPTQSFLGDSITSYPWLKLLPVRTPKEGHILDLLTSLQVELREREARSSELERASASERDLGPFKEKQASDFEKV